RSPIHDEADHAHANDARAPAGSPAGLRPGPRERRPPGRRPVVGVRRRPERHVAAGWTLAAPGRAGPAGPVAAGALREPRTGATTVLPAQLGHARAGHTATLLPDGTVLILGGLDAGGRVLDRVERFDAATERFEPVAAPGLVPRAFHTATLLT